MLAMKIVLLLGLVSLIRTRNVLIIGDSRTVGFGEQTLGFTVNRVDDKEYIIRDKAKSYGGDRIQLIAQSGAAYNTFQDHGNEVTGAVERVLRSTKEKKFVFIWLGVNDPNVDGTFNYYKSLTRLCKKCKFYAISVAGVADKFIRDWGYVDNEKIKQFNNGLRKKIKDARISNLKFKYILENEEPTRIFNKKLNRVTLEINDSTTDWAGLHFLKDGCEAVLNAILSCV